MPKSFPRAPVPFLSALLSPLAWLYGRPDLFDSYSAGVMLLQLSGLFIFFRYHWCPSKHAHP